MERRLGPRSGALVDALHLRRGRAHTGAQDARSPSSGASLAGGTVTCTTRWHHTQRHTGPTAWNPGQDLHSAAADEGGHGWSPGPGPEPHARRMLSLRLLQELVPDIAHGRSSQGRGRGSGSTRQHLFVAASQARSSSLWSSAIRFKLISTQWWARSRVPGHRHPLAVLARLGHTLAVRCHAAHGAALDARLWRPRPPPGWRRRGPWTGTLRLCCPL